MIWQRVEFKVGLLMLVALALLIFLLFNASNLPISTGEKLKVYFNYASDIQKGAPVHLAGVRIGRVTGKKLLEDEVHLDKPYSVQITAHIKSPQPLREGCKITIGTLGFVGEAYLDIRNGPYGNPELPKKQPVIGIDPVSVATLLETAEETINNARESVLLVKNAVTSNQDEIKMWITDFKQFVAATTQSLEKTMGDVDKLLVSLNHITSENQHALKNAIANTNRLIKQVETDSKTITTQVENVTGLLTQLVEQNATNVNGTLKDAQQLTARLKNLANQLETDLPALKTEISQLVSNTQNVVNRTSPKFDKLLGNLEISTSHLETTMSNLDGLLNRIQNGDGTVAKLINDQTTLDDARKTLNNANETMSEFKRLSQKLNQKSDILKMPKFSYDYELRYLSINENLHNELAFSLSSSPTQRFRFGFSVREEDIDYELQFCKNIGYFSARAGFIRSKIGLGLDYWLLKRRFGLTLEGTNIATNNPEIDLETSLRLLPNWYLILGGEYLKDSTEDKWGFSTGIKAMY